MFLKKMTQYVFNRFDRIIMIGVATLHLCDFTSKESSHFFSHGFIRNQVGKHTKNYFKLCEGLASNQGHSFTLCLFVILQIIKDKDDPFENVKWTRQPEEEVVIGCEMVLQKNLLRFNGIAFVESDLVVAQFILEEMHKVRPECNIETALNSIKPKIMVA